MYEYLLFGPLIVLFLLLIYHSTKTEGKRNTIIFFGFGMTFALVRELVVGLICPLYSGKFKIGPISPAIVFGWVFAFYLGHAFASQITSKTHLKVDFLTKILLGTIVVVGVSLVMETTASDPLLEWWTWNVDVSMWPQLFNRPIFVFIGWGFTGLVFLTTFYILQESGFTPKSLLTIISLYIIVICGVTVGNLFIQPPAFVHGFLIASLIFSSLYFVIITIYIKKNKSKSIPENVLLNVFYSMACELIIVIFASVPFQPLFLTITLIFLGVLVLFIVKQGYLINSLMKERLQNKSDSTKIS